MNNYPVALITGSARRIGAAIVKALHQAGSNVVLHFHTSQPEAEALCQALNEQRQDSAHLIQGDLRIAQQELVEQAVSFWGRLDGLVNNASRFYPTVVGQSTRAMWEDLMSTNAMAPYFLAQAAAPFLKKQHGSIVNICDIHGKAPLKDYGIYCVSKAALIMQTRVLAKELAPDIRVNGVSPGAVAWPEGENTLSKATQQKILAKIPLQRIGCPEDIAKAVCFLMNQASDMTGQILAVDGGRSLQ